MFIYEHGREDTFWSANITPEPWPGGVGVVLLKTQIFTPGD